MFVLYSYLTGRSDSEQSETSSQNEGDDDDNDAAAVGSAPSGSQSPDEMAAFEQRAIGSSALQPSDCVDGAGSSSRKESSRKEKAKKEKGKSDNKGHPDKMDLNQLLSAGEGILQISILQGSMHALFPPRPATPRTHIHIHIHFTI